MSSASLAQGGYVVGPTLAPDERPWPVDWEQDPRIDDGHPHEWECCLLKADGDWRSTMEEVVRCRVCLAPRCGHSRDHDPCMKRRHHRPPHVTLTGHEEPF